MKVIAIRPLKDCCKDYLKLLKPGQIYYLYNNYEIGKGDLITTTSPLPSDFYEVVKPTLNISAIVGKNGAGKSTIIELLFRAINNISYKQKKVIADLTYIDDIRVEIYFETDTYYKVQVIGKSVSFFKYNSRTKRIDVRVKDFDLKSFFYTVTVNYSLYAYNTNDIDNEGRWLDGLFHKNDGYQTPIVLNPLRTEGIIDINNENHLVKSRLIANLLRPTDNNVHHFRELTHKLNASFLRLKVNKSKENTVLFTIPSKRKRDPIKVTLKDLIWDKNLILSKLNSHFKFNYSRLDKTKNNVALDYILYKVVSIAIKYYNHNNLYFIKEEKGFDTSKLDEFFKELFQDKSHITLKLRQTLRFLRFQHIGLKDQDIYLDDLSKINTELLSKRSNIDIESAELVPPPIFSVEIFLTPKDDRDKQISFKTLSSGEKQMIYSVSSFLYHLVNLDSIPSNTKRRTAYRYINIILEEIELYAHPDMQRKYAQYIIDSIKNLKLERTQGINLCFVTHSPFILSDIPAYNILFLENGSPNTDKMLTFGGNIHDLLAHSFFLEEGTIGDFALKKIQSIIDKLNGENKLNESERQDIELCIKLIGEPFLRDKLLDMYYNKFDKQKRISELESELKKLKQ